MSNAASTERQFGTRMRLIPMPRNQPKESFPYFQWHHNSDLEDLGNDDVRYRGGWLFNLAKGSRHGKLTLPGFDSTNVKLGQDKQPCLAAPSADLPAASPVLLDAKKTTEDEKSFSAKQNQHQLVIGKIRFWSFPPVFRRSMRRTSVYSDRESHRRNLLEGSCQSAHGFDSACR
ncbi:MAG: hypothetical protein U0Y68_27180 [Blastocatellia bacterium]